jgi:GNAT superfamily N-acetyltransferase
LAGVIADANDVVVAYTSVAMTGIDRSAAPQVLAKGAPDPVPALLLGRLGVDHRYVNLGIGTALAGHVLATAVELNEKAACRAVVVTALNARPLLVAAARLRAVASRGPRPVNLYVLSADIEATPRRVR